MNEVWVVNASPVITMAKAGTLGAILRAKKMGLIESASQAIRALRAVGLRLDDQVIRVSLDRVVGETWPLLK